VNKDFLCLSDWSLEDLEKIFALTSDLKSKQQAGIEHQLLAGKTLGMLFEKSSTRTRVSLEAGMYHLGGHALFLASGNTQMGRGEPIKDTARCMARYVDGVMIRTYSQQVIEEFASYSSVPVINGLTDSYHPCQIMADLFTVSEHRENYRELSYCWIGDGNNMANTLSCVSQHRSAMNPTPGSASGLPTPGQRSYIPTIHLKPHAAHRFSTPMSGPAWARKPSNRNAKKPLPDTRSIWTWFDWLTRIAWSCIVCQPIEMRRSPTKSWRAVTRSSTMKRRTDCMYRRPSWQH
jgi:hypothetical protein